MAQLGSALDWGSRGRRFKSGQPDSSPRPFFGVARSLVALPASLVQPTISVTCPVQYLRGAGLGGAAPREKTYWGFKVRRSVSITVLVATLVACGSGQVSESSTSAPATGSVSSIDTTTTSTSTTARKDRVTTTSAEVTTTAGSSLTRAQENANGSAESYIRITAFSRKELIEQLELDGFETSDADFAVDRLGVDW